MATRLRGSVLAAVLIPAGLLSSAAGPATQHTGALPCVDDQLVSVAYVLADLSTTDQPIDGAGRIYTFRAADGSTAQQVTVPRGFQPITAFATELEFYGFPSRPTDPVALASWTVDFSDWRGRGDPGMCTLVGAHS